MLAPRNSEILVKPSGNELSGKHIRRTWQMRPPIYPLLQIRDEGAECHVKPPHLISSDRQTITNRVSSTGHWLERKTPDEHQPTLEYPRELVCKKSEETKHRERLVGIKHNFLDAKLAVKSTHKCEMCNRPLRRDASVCNKCTVKLIVNHKKSWTSDILWSIDNELDDLLGHERSTTRYMRNVKRNMQTRHLMMGLNPKSEMRLNLPTISGTKITPKSDKALPDTNRKSRIDYLWGIVRDAVIRGNIRKITKWECSPRNSQLWRVALKVVQGERKRKGFNLSGAISDLINRRLPANSEDNLSPVRKYFLRSDMAESTTDHRGRAIYRTTKQAKEELLYVRNLFTSISSPTLKIRPIPFWSILEKHSVLENMKPILTALQANRLESPFDCFLGEEWLVEYKKHYAVERERVQLLLETAQRDIYKLDNYKRPSRRLHLTNTIGMDGDDDLNVKEIWHKYGVRAQIRAKKRGLADQGLHMVGSKVLSREKREQKKTDEARKQGRRAAMTSPEVILQLRKARKAKSLSKLKDLKKASPRSEVKPSPVSTIMEASTESSVTDPTQVNKSSPSPPRKSVSSQGREKTKQRRARKSV